MVDSVQINRSSKYNTVELVYSMIQKHSGELTSKLLEKEIGNKYVGHYAITRLTKDGRIKRVRGFGPNRIEFFYLDIG